MEKWDMNDYAAQENQPLTSDDDEMDSGDHPPPRRERGQTFSENKMQESQRQSLMQDLVRLACAFEPVKKGKTEPTNEAQENRTHTLEGNGSMQGKNSEIGAASVNTDTRAVNRKNHTRKHTMVDCRSIQGPFSAEEQGQLQGGSQHKLSSPGGGGPDMVPGSFAWPSKPSKS